MSFRTGLVIVAVLALFVAWRYIRDTEAPSGSGASGFAPALDEPAMTEEAKKARRALPEDRTEEQWRLLLTPEQFQVCRKGGTERAYTGATWDTKSEGVYRCVCCDEPLFASDTKFDSGTGWPSFFRPVADGQVALREDRGWFTTRTEVVCARCNAHLGHVFDDGPAPTGLRYCMNSAALKFEPAGDEK